MKTIVAVLLLAVTAALPLMADRPDMTTYLPRPDEPPGWAPSDKPQHFEGENLFQLINGGAEIYHEYGFKQVIAQGFKHKKSGKSFNLEIYEMTDADAAYGIYSFKTGHAGIPLAVGDEGRLEDYYINFRKGCFLVTLTGFDSEKATVDGIRAAAAVVAKKITGSAPKPDLVNMLPKAYQNQLKPNGVTYLKGNLALFNRYAFDSADIFGLKEGVIGHYRDFTLFIFTYPDAAESKRRLTHAAKRLKTNPRFRGFTERDGGFSLTDEKGAALHFRRRKQYILVALAKTADAARSVLLTLTPSLTPYP